MQKFTNVPLPSFTSLAKALFQKSAYKKEFLKFWELENHLTLSLSRSAWSMQLIARYRLKMTQDSKLNILLPSYFCNSSLAPLRELDTHLSFYPINCMGEPDLKEIREILLEKKIDIIVGVHFFGNYMDFTELCELTKNSNIWFVEDCAHLLNYPKNVEIKSDFQLFSPHKFLAISDGAILSVNERIFNKLNDIEEFRKIHQSYIRESSQTKAYMWLLKRILQKFSIGIKLGINDFYTDIQVNNSKDFFKPGMTSLSKTLLSKINLSTEKENAKRLENADTWKNILLGRFPSAEVIFRDSSYHSIYLLGLKFSSEIELQEALHWIKMKKYPVCTWPDLPDEVLVKQDYFKNSIHLRNRCIFFQVHSSIHKKHIESSI